MVILLTNAIIEKVALVAQEPRLLQEPLMTWNFFLTAFLVPVCSALTAGILMAYINWKMKKQEKHSAQIAQEKLEADEEINRLKREIEGAKDAALNEWRTNHMDVLCKVKDKVEGIYDELANLAESKVSKDDCDRLRGNC